MPKTREYKRDLAALSTSLISVSVSGPFTVGFSGPVLAIAMWRNLLGALATLPFAWRHRSAFRALTRRQLVLMSMSGVLLALHFATWMGSLRYTSIAASTALVATQVVWAALLAFRDGHRAPRMEWIGIGIALFGVLVLTGIDFGLDARAIVGDALAVLGAMTAAAYVNVGQKLRSEIPLNIYTSVVYLISAATLFAMVLIAGLPWRGFGAQDWLLILGVTLFAQIGGHSLMNQALRSFSATTISLGLLLEVPGATLVGWIWPGQTPPWQLLPALVMVLTGLVIVLRSSREPLQTEAN